MWEDTKDFVINNQELIVFSVMVAILTIAAAQLAVMVARYFFGKGKPMAIKTRPAWRARLRFVRRADIPQAELDAVCDVLTDAFEDAIHENRLTRDQVEYWYRNIGVSAYLPGLIPMSARKRQEYLYQLNGDTAVSPQKTGWLKRIITFRRANGLHATDPADLPVEAKAPEKVVDKVKHAPKGKGFKELNNTAA